MFNWWSNTCSHKIVLKVNQRAEKFSFPVAKIHSASVNALKNVLEEYCV